MSQPEYRIVRQIERHCRLEGFWYMKVHGNQYVRQGIPDLLLCVRGVFVGIEVKQPGEKPTPLQEFELGRIVGAGGVAGCARSLEEAISIIGVALMRVDGRAT